MSNLNCVPHAVVHQRCTSLSIDTIITAGLVSCFKDIQYFDINHFSKNKTFWAIGLVLTFQKSDYYS